ncbi:hypothetical protein HX362_000398 [Salmonella enterica]|nr:hypothetical protein [Salmonella enterica]
MIITGNTTIIGNLTGNTGNTGNQPQPATRPAFITPKADTSAWSASGGNTGISPDWVITKGVHNSSGYSTAYSLLSPWEIQHDIPDAGDMFLFNGRIRISGVINIPSDRGKDIAEVRLVIPDGEATRYCPPATPDKPYLVVGFILRFSSNGTVAAYGLESGINDKPVFDFYSSNGFSAEIAVESSVMYLVRSEQFVVWFPATRTAVKTPENKLCISSGTNPTNKVSFQLLESVAYRENIKHTLTPEDDGATFYSPSGSRDNIRITVPDTPFPQGFSVNIINESSSYITVLCGSRNIYIQDNGRDPASYLTKRYGRFKLMQTGIDGKTWRIV